jgi:hypothetical protein
VRDAARRRDRLDREPFLDAFEAVPEPHAAAQHDRHDGDVQVVDQVLGEELADDGRPAADADVEAAGGLTRLAERLLRRGVDEVEGGAALHLDGRPRVVGQDEHRGVEDGVGAPPAVPLVVLPRAALGAELVAPHDLRADPGTPGGRQRVVDAGAAAAFALHGPERLGGEEPLHELLAGVTEGRVEALALARAEAVQ